MREGLVVWFTGLSGSGKSTIAQGVAELLTSQRISVEIVDGDALRQTVGKHLGFSAEDVMKSNDLAVGICSKLRQRCDVVLVPRVSPFRSARRIARETFGEAFAEVYVRASVQAVEARDPKGLYEKARSGSGTALIGMPGGLPFEAPANPELLLDTEAYSQQPLVEKLASYATDWLELRNRN